MKRSTWWWKNDLCDSGSGGWKSWDQNRRSEVISIMRSNYLGIFHEIESFNNKFQYNLIRRSKLWSWDPKSKNIKIALLLTIDLITEAASTINFIRLKVWKQNFWLLISWKICLLQVWSWDQKFYALVANN